MPRRMQANDEAPRAHTVEHDELWDCDRHPPCEPVPVPRRMKPNLRLSTWNRHYPEHDENSGCPAGIPCEPVEEKKPVSSLAKAIAAIPETGPNHNYRGLRIDSSDAYDLVRDLVVVPNTGTYLVVAGAVHTSTDPGAVVQTRYEPGRTTYTFIVEDSKPPFFVEGKTYATGWGARFKVDRVKEHIAFGFYTDRDNPEGRWTLMGHFPGWEEVQ